MASGRLTTSSYFSAARFQSFWAYRRLASLKLLTALSVLHEYLPQPAAATLSPSTRAMDVAEAARNRMVMLSPSRADYNETRGQYIGGPAGRQPTPISSIS